MKRGYRYGSLARKWFLVLLGFGSASAVAKARAYPNHSPRVVEQEGFYRVELGDVEVTALSDGTTPLYDAPCGAGFHGDVIAHEDRYEKNRVTARPRRSIPRRATGQLYRRPNRG